MPALTVTPILERAQVPDALAVNEIFRCGDGIVTNELFVLIRSSRALG
jgi:hypothetical protein